GQEAHRQRRSDEQEDHADVAEQVAQRRLTSADQDEREQVARHHQEQRGDDVGNGRDEVGLQLSLGDRQGVAHAATASSEVVSFKNISSRLRATGRSSNSPQPLLTTAFARLSRASLPISQATV